MLMFSALSRAGIEISTPRKIAIGMGPAGMAFLFPPSIHISKPIPQASSSANFPTR